MKETPTNNDRIEYKNAHKLNNEATTENKRADIGADNNTLVTATKPSMHEWTPPSNYPPNTVAIHHQHYDIKGTDQSATRPKYPPHMKNQLTVTITLTTTAPSNTGERIEENCIHI